MATAPLPLTDLGCCSSMAGTPLSPEAAEKLARTLKAIADPTRLRLLSLVASHRGGEACICDLTDPVGLTQPTVSHHMRTLVDAGILTREQRGKWAYFRVVPGAIDTLGDLLTTVTGNRTSLPASR